MSKKQLKNELIDTIPETLHTFTNWSSLLSVQKYQLLDRSDVRCTSNLTQISWNIFARKCSSYDWSNGPIRLQYMPTLWSDISSLQYE